MINARKDYDEAVSFDPEKFPDPTEPVLVIRGKDKYFTEMVNYYRDLVDEDDDRWDGDNDTVVASEKMSVGLGVFENYAQRWQSENTDKVKTSDVPNGQMKTSGEYPLL